ncbi:MAG: aminotransferase class V-fold PLP-dependent enzyme, partial [Patescibacteria group bacterium]
MFFLKPKKNKRVYLDTAAATPVDKRVRRALEPYLSFQFGNPGSIHQEGVLAKQAVTQARIMVAQSLVCLPEEIIFTSGGTESNNLAIVGTALLYEKKHGQLGRLITTAIEHRSILEPAQYLKSRGWDIVILPVAPAGSLDLKKLEQEITPNTALVSLGYGNNEIGTIFPVREVAKIIRRFRKNNLTTYPLFHLDACQAPRFLPLRTAKLGVDLLTINGSKIYGPKGSGVLYKRKEIEIAAVVYGGGQESGMRSGTENVAGI